ncbi:MAG: transcription antitermination factor NusB [Planctomycetota bacterium]|nr:transcription antitermination factor NusB [Planctomycetota bacterium]
MASPRDIRRCALQCLYQFDAQGANEPEEVRQSLENSPGGHEAREEGFKLGCLTWEHYEDADEIIAPLTPEWPIHRQPVVDRSLLRLAYYEMISGRTPPKVVINEAVELAKEFSTEKSPMFINGVLDKIYRQLRDAEKIPQPTNASPDA